jgi:hypothetical protein
VTSGTAAGYFGGPGYFEGQAFKFAADHTAQQSSVDSGESSGNRPSKSCPTSPSYGRSAGWQKTREGQAFEFRIRPQSDSRWDKSRRIGGDRSSRVHSKSAEGQAFEFRGWQKTREGHASNFVSGLRATAADKSRLASGGSGLRGSTPGQQRDRPSNFAPDGQGRTSGDRPSNFKPRIRRDGRSAITPHQRTIRGTGLRRISYPVSARQPLNKSRPHWGDRSSRFTQGIRGTDLRISYPASERQRLNKSRPASGGQLFEGPLQESRGRGLPIRARRTERRSPRFGCMNLAKECHVRWFIPPHGFRRALPGRSPRSLRVRTSRRSVT